MSDRIEKLLEAARKIADGDYPPPTPELNGVSLMRYIDIRHIDALREALKSFPDGDEQ